LILMNSEHYRVSIERLENGFMVEIPDLEKMAEMKAAAKKKAGKDSPMVEPYMGDCVKKFAAKNVKEVLALVQGSLKTIPEAEFDSAFDEAAAETMK